MNSDEEKALFEINGWEKNYAKGEWVSPGATARITDHQLVEYVETREGEQQLRQIIVAYGNKKTY